MNRLRNDDDAYARYASQTTAPGEYMTRVPRLLGGPSDCFDVGVQGPNVARVPQGGLVDVDSALMGLTQRASRTQTVRPAPTPVPVSCTPGLCQLHRTDTRLSNPAGELRGFAPNRFAPNVDAAFQERAVVPFEWFVRSRDARFKKCGGGV